MMKISKSLLVISILASAVFADDCQTWRWNNAAFEMDTCARSSGTSGYTILRNLTNSKMKVCWEITFNGGKTSSGCNSGLWPNTEPRSSCYSCGNKGVRSVNLTKFEKASY